MASNEDTDALLRAEIARQEEAAKQKKNEGLAAIDDARQKINSGTLPNKIVNEIAAFSAKNGVTINSGFLADSYNLDNLNVLHITPLSLEAKAALMVLSGEEPKFNLNGNIQYGNTNSSHSGAKKGWASALNLFPTEQFRSLLVKHTQETALAEARDAAPKTTPVNYDKAACEAFPDGRPVYFGKINVCPPGNSRQ